MVLPTGLLSHLYAEQEVLYPVFGDDGWTRERTGRAEWRWKASGPLCPLIARTGHPQAKSDTAEVAMAIGQKIVDAAPRWVGRLLPWSHGWPS